MGQATTEGLMGIGRVAAVFGISPSVIRKWERAGFIPTVPRVSGQDRRVYRVDDLTAIGEKVAEMHAAARQRSDPERAA